MIKRPRNWYLKRIYVFEKKVSKRMPIKKM